MKKTLIAIIGDFQDGKSTLINALCGHQVAAVGDLSEPKTAEAAIYPIPGTDCELMDTPGFNSVREEDDALTLAAVQRADAFFLILRDAKLSESLQRKILRCWQESSGTWRPLLPIINEWEEHPGKKQLQLNDNAVAILRKRNLKPILFGKEMPIVNAEDWAAHSRDRKEYEKGERLLKYLLGIDPQAAPSPITRICAMMKALQQIIKH